MSDHQFSDETIQKVRQQLAEERRSNGREAQLFRDSGGTEGFQVENLQAYVEQCEKDAQNILDGRTDDSPNFIARAQTVDAEQ